ncbi:MAG: enoyl-CoA hydratase [Acidobacterium sp.]|nr:enoyl-CoA hydratase [Acidobacteriota bacterium]PHY12222.1 MAG: enoyl-CoA hydratase [Acidobacterium sp.]
MTFENLLLERDGAVAIVTLNRPKVLNALNHQTLAELSACMASLKADEGVRAIILTGSGEKSFVAGADINELATQSPVEGQAHARRGQLILDAIEQLGKPVIAAINGFALGGGCELAMACTIRLAADSARFGQPEINLGLMPGYAGSQRLPRLVGKGIAMEMLLTGDMVGAQRAYEIGLVNRVVPAAELMTEARALAQTLAAKAPIAVGFIIDAVNQGLEAPFAVGEYLETSLFGTIASSEDMREGTKAFLDKRKPVWQGK